MSCSKLNLYQGRQVKRFVGL